MQMIADDVVNVRLGTLGAIEAICNIQIYLDIVASSDSDESVRCGNQIIVPPRQVLPRGQMMIVAEWLGILPAVVEDAGHGSGLL
jgi:hypothetical protein